MFFDDWNGLLRVVIVGTLAYAAVVVVLRCAGKRTLSKLNAFDLVVTVALGSTLATVLLSKDVALAEGVVALALLAGLQYTVAWLSLRSSPFRRAITSEPTLLARSGRMLPQAMERERIHADELLAAVRASGRAGLGDVEAVVLETDGTLSVLGSDTGGDAALEAAARAERQATAAR